MAYSDTRRIWTFLWRRSEGYDFQEILDKTAKDLRAAGFELTVHPSSDKTVHSAFFRFPRLLYEADLSPHEEEKISIKIEIDTNPPSGAQTDTTVINRHFLLSLWHYDLPSLMAGKIHALLTRDYTKGETFMTSCGTGPVRSQLNLIWRC